uniref:Uncharacterized protein n=1 Tax=Anguilla anguilla TaxID=7936 RepID=A0A0E9WLB3_ANGAN
MIRTSSDPFPLVLSGKIPM